METIETVFQLSQGNTVPGSVVGQLTNFKNGDEIHFKLLNRECIVYCSKGINSSDFKSPPEFDVNIYFEDLNITLVEDKDIEKMKQTTGLEFLRISFDTVLQFRTDCEKLRNEGTTADPKVCLDLMEYLILYVNGLKPLPRQKGDDV